MEASRMEGGGTENEDGGVDEEREAESKCGIEDGVTEGFATLLRFGAEGARLHEAGEKIEIVGHDGGTEDADGNVEHFAIAEDLGVGNEATRSLEPERAREENFVGKAGADGEDECDDEGFQHAEAAALEQEDDENVESSENDAE